MKIIKFEKKSGKVEKAFTGRRFIDIVREILRDPKEKENFFEKRNHIKNKYISPKEVFILGDKEYKYIYFEDRKKRKKIFKND